MNEYKDRIESESGSIILITDHLDESFILSQAYGGISWWWTASQDAIQSVLSSSSGSSDFPETDATVILSHHPFCVERKSLDLMLPFISSNNFSLQFFSSTGSLLSFISLLLPLLSSCPHPIENDMKRGRRLKEFLLPLSSSSHASPAPASSLSLFLIVSGRERLNLKPHHLLILWLPSLLFPWTSSCESHAITSSAPHSLLLSLLFWDWSDSIRLLLLFCSSSRPPLLLIPFILFLPVIQSMSEVNRELVLIEERRQKIWDERG